MNIEEIKNNKTKMILQFAVPSIIAMLLTASLTITDGFFIGNYVGKAGIPAVNLGLPILYLFLGIGLMIGVGGSVIAVCEVGKGNNKKAGSIFTQTIITALIVCIIMSIITYVCMNPLLKLFGADGITKKYFLIYYIIMLFDYPIMTLGSCLGMFVRADGRPQFSMLVSIIGTLLNAILDYVFVAKLGLGIKGIAIASLLVVLAQAVIQLLYFVKASNIFHYCRPEFDLNIFKQSIFNGSSEFIGEMAGCLSMFCYNYAIMRHIGQSGVAAFSILGYAVYAHNMIVIGFGQGMCPLVGFTIGAGEKDTALKLRKSTNKMVFIIGIIVAAVMFLFGETYARCFINDKTIIDMIASGFRLFAVTFIITGFNVIGSMYFTSCKKAAPSAIISALRGLLLLIPLILIFTSLWGMTGVWLAAPVTEIITAIVTVYLIIADNCAGKSIVTA